MTPATRTSPRAGIARRARRGTAWRLAGWAPIVLAGCAQAPAAPDGAPALPPAYRQGCSIRAQPGAAAAPAQWWLGFKDPALNRAVDRALAGNPGLAQAEARQVQAEARSQAAGAALRPGVDLDAGVADVRQSLLDPDALVASDSPAFRRRFVENRTGASAAWEIDVAGGLRAARTAAQADSDAAAALVQAARAGLAADVGDAYLRLRGGQLRLAIAARQEDVERRLVDLVGQRVAEGIAAPRELDSAAAVLEGVRATMPPLRAAVDTELAQLDVLMGAAPGTYREELEVGAPLPETPAVAVGQGPADLLRSRPDVRAAELRLAASRSRVTSALGEYYPKLTLSALLGWSSAVAGRAFGGDALQGDVGLGLRWRLFDFGRIDAEVAAARGRQREALAAYRAAVLGAALEVETAFVALLQGRSRAVALERQIGRLDSALERTRLAYGQGAVSLLEVLDLDRQRLAAGDQHAAARTEAARGAVASFRALGGGWPQPAAADAAPPDPGVCPAADRAPAQAVTTQLQGPPP